MTRSAANHWDEWQRRQVPGRFADWADHPFVMQRICAHAFGDAGCGLMDFIGRQLPELAHAHVLSLCCGDASFELAMLEQGRFGRVTGIDVSPERIASAARRLQASGPGLAERLDLQCADVNSAHFGVGRYDVVFAKSALHHIENLEHALAAMARCLKPQGVLVTIDFFGPTRFQWTDAQLQARQWFWQQRVPAALRHDANGEALPELTRPSVASMIALDPSEAVRSGELHALVLRHFEPLHDVALGGSLMNLLLYGEIVNRFDPDQPAHNAVIAEAFEFERLLMELGVLGSDFRLLIARARQGTGAPGRGGLGQAIRRLIG